MCMYSYSRTCIHAFHAAGSVTPFVRLLQIYVHLYMYIYKYTCTHTHIHTYCRAAGSVTSFARLLQLAKASGKGGNTLAATAAVRTYLFLADTLQKSAAEGVGVSRVLDDVWAQVYVCVCVSIDR